MLSKDICSIPPTKSGKEGGFDSDRILIELEALYNHFHHSSLGVAETYRRIATALRESNPKVTWTWSYLHMVARKKIQPSSKLTCGISNLYSQAILGNDTHLERVEILAPVGLVEPDALLAQATRRCKRCNRSFLPKVSNQIYCTVNCRKNRSKGISSA